MTVSTLVKSSGETIQVGSLQVGDRIVIDADGFSLLVLPCQCDWQHSRN
ncbi:hypothetical protein [Nostoc sp.]